MELSLYKCVGKGYTNGWWTNCKCRYRIFKGARNTKKSYDILGFEVIDKIISDSRRNVLILRQTFTSHRNSTFVKLCKLINQPDQKNPKVSFSRFFKISKNDMTITYKPTGQVILFKGMDDAQKIQSIDVMTGYLTDVYVEEAWELKSYDEWHKVDGSIRGKLPNGVFHQITFCLNAWDIGHWIYDKFFKDRFEDDYNYLKSHTYQDWKDEDYIGDFGKGLYLHTSTYKINEFRDTEVYDLSMEHMRMTAPELYKVIALGMWGNTADSTYPEMSEKLILSRAQVYNKRFAYYAIGIDTGLSNGEGKVKRGEDVRIRSATTMQFVGITSDFNQLVCVDEFFHSNENQQIKKTEPELMKDVIKKIIEWKRHYGTHPDLMKGTILVYVDCADIGFRQGLELEARNQGLFNVEFIASTKIPIQSRVDFIRLIMAYGDFLISEACTNLIREIKNARKGKKGEVREDIDDHAINANEYAWAVLVKKLRRWKDFKMH